MATKHLFKFETEADYKTAKKNHLTLPNVSSVVESGNVYINSRFVSKQKAEAGDIIVYREHSNGVKEVKYMKPEAYDKSDPYWKADAVVVVPYSHTGDGTVRAMALNYASLSTPETGGVPTAIKWGTYFDVAGITNCRYAISFSQIDEQTMGTYGTKTDVYLPSDTFTGTLNPYDEETNYISNTPIAPSPYNNDGSKNDAYHSLGDFAGVTRNCLKYMNGKNNTLEILKCLNQNYLSETLFAETITFSGTQPKKTIFDSSIEPVSKTITEVGQIWYDENNTLHTATDDDLNTTVQDYTACRITLDIWPAAIACARYSSVLKPCTYDPTKSLEENIATMPWYLPAIGELCYSIVRQKRINYAMSQIGATADNSVEKYLWSSTEDTDKAYAWFVSTTSGYVTHGIWNTQYRTKAHAYRVRPFAAF